MADLTTSYTKEVPIFNGYFDVQSVSASAVATGVAGGGGGGGLSLIHI